MGKSLNGKELDKGQYENEKAINVVTKDITLDERKNSKKILSDMLEKAIDADLLRKNVAKQVNTVITMEEKKERRVLTIKETELFWRRHRAVFIIICMCWQWKPV